MATFWVTLCVVLAVIRHFNCRSIARPRKFLLASLLLSASQTILLLCLSPIGSYVSSVLPYIPEFVGSIGIWLIPLWTAFMVGSFSWPLVSLCVAFHCDSKYWEITDLNAIGWAFIILALDCHLINSSTDTTLLFCALSTWTTYRTARVTFDLLNEPKLIMVENDEKTRLMPAATV